mmetsp:Transcript_37670/g.111444  ORF Transcript_37670/g.111444 Transcript_37670/m.111444 type:complete len:264 (+) Transcript_37670:3775-4566(+)|eukprot:352386-Chlamydomonas_euryale.AAC.10
MPPAPCHTAVEPNAAVTPEMLSATEPGESASGGAKAGGDAAAARASPRTPSDRWVFAQSNAPRSQRHDSRSAPAWQAGPARLRSKALQCASGGAAAAAHAAPGMPGYPWGPPPWSPPPPQLPCGCTAITRIACSNPIGRTDSGELRCSAASSASMTCEGSGCGQRCWAGATASKGACPSGAACLAAWLAGCAAAASAIGIMAQPVGQPGEGHGRMTCHAIRDATLRVSRAAGGGSGGEGEGALAIGEGRRSRVEQMEGLEEPC